MYHKYVADSKFVADAMKEKEAEKEAAIRDDALQITVSQLNQIQNDSGGRVNINQKCSNGGTPMKLPNIFNKKDKGVSEGSQTDNLSTELGTQTDPTVQHSIGTQTGTQRNSVGTQVGSTAQHSVGVQATTAQHSVGVQANPSVTDGSTQTFNSLIRDAGVQTENPTYADSSNQTHFVESVGTDPIYFGTDVGLQTHILGTDMGVQTDRNLRDAIMQTRPTHPPPNSKRVFGVQTDPIITEQSDRETQTVSTPKFLLPPPHPPPTPKRAFAIQTEPIITELSDRETQTIASGPIRLSDTESQTVMSGGPQIVEAVVHPPPSGVTTTTQTPDFLINDNDDANARALSSDDELMFDLGVGTTTRRRIKKRLPPADNHSNAIEYIDRGLKAIEYKPDDDKKVKKSKVKKPKSKLPPLQAPKSKVPKQQQQQPISSLQFVMPQLPPDPRPREYVSPNLLRMHHNIIREELLHHPRGKAVADKLKMRYGMSPSTSGIRDRIMKQQLLALDMNNPNRIVPQRPPKPTPRKLEKRPFEEEEVTVQLSKEDIRKPKMKKKEIVPKRPPKPTPRELEKRPLEEDKITVQLSKEDTRRKPKARILAKDDDDLW